MNFRDVEQKVTKLRQDFTEGLLTEDQLKQQLSQLMLQDENGDWWMVGHETMQWYRHNGESWIRDQPPIDESSRSPKKPPEIQTGKQPLSRYTRRTAFWSLAFSFVPGSISLLVYSGIAGLLPYYDAIFLVPGLILSGVGIIGIIASIAMLEKNAWGRKLGVFYANLMALTGVLWAVLVVLVLVVSTIWKFAIYFWVPCVLAILCMSTGIILACRLESKQVLNDFGEEQKRHLSAWPISIPVILTGLGIIPSIGFLRSREWGRILMLWYLSILVPLVVFLAVVAGLVMPAPNPSGSSSNEWGFAISLLEAFVISVWLILAILNLRSESAKKWFSD